MQYNGNVFLGHVPLLLTPINEAGGGFVEYLALVCAINRIWSGFKKHIFQMEAV
jgi:hypothetical protein